MKKTLLVCLAALLLLSQCALAETTFATDSISLSLSSTWMDLKTADDNYDAVYMNPDGVILFVMMEGLLDDPAYRETIQEIMNNTDEGFLVDALHRTLTQRVSEFDANPQIQTAEMAPGLVGCYCTVMAGGQLITFIDVMSESEIWHMFMGASTDDSLTRKPMEVADFEAIARDEILSGMSFRGTTLKPAFSGQNSQSKVPTVEAPHKGSGTIVMNDVLDALGEASYRTAYDALKAGEVVQKGRRSDANRGVQQMLAAFGQKISVDGSIGGKTIAALNAVQEAFGLEKTDALDLAGFEKLLPRLLISVNPDAAERLVKGTMDSDEYQYMEACALVAQGKYYSAKAAFQKSSYGDWEQRAADCVQKWPRTGVLYKNPGVSGSSAQFRMTINSKDPGEATFVKIYTTDNVLARTMFIGGSGTATASIPGGTYIIRYGTGKNWYGETEAFGREGYYEVLTFENGTQETRINKNYRQTITVNVETKSPSSGTVNSDYIGWENF